MRGVFGGRGGCRRGASGLIERGCLTSGWIVWIVWIVWIIAMVSDDFDDDETKEMKACGFNLGSMAPQNTVPSSIVPLARTF